MPGLNKTSPHVGLLSYFARHKTAANLLLVIMMVLGLAAATQIRSQFFPDVIIDSVSVNVTWEGAGPQEVDNAIVGLLEPVLLNVEGAKQSSSRATEGRASIILEFEPNWDMARAAEDVRSAVDAVTDMPEESDEPIVRRSLWRDRVTDVVIYGPVSQEQLGRYGDELTARLFRAGVSRSSIRGVPSGEITVEVSEAALVQHDVTLRDIATVIAEEANTDPAGDMASGAARVRTGVEKRETEDIQNITIRAQLDGSKLKISDVAQVTEETGATGRSYFVGKNAAISIRVDRADLGDAIAIQNTVQKVAQEMQASLPPDIRVELIRTRAQSITDRLNILLENGLLGLVLVVALLFLFLNTRTALWVAAGIPVAMFAAIALMYLGGLTINMVSLFGLIICLGIVVDDAIVVGEHADFRARRLGEDPTTASVNAARRMSLPVISATITTVIAFFGLTVVGGRFGALINDIPFTVIAVLLASLAECFLILPHHMRHALASRAKERWYDLPNILFNRGFTWFRVTVFRPFINWVIILRYPVLAAVILVLASQIALFIRGDVQWRFFNAPERGSISGNFAMLPGAERSDTKEMMFEIQRAVKATSAAYETEFGVNPVEFTLAQLGGTTGRGLAGEETKDKEQLGSIAIELIDADLRPYSSFAFLARLQEQVVRHPKLETLSFRGWHSGPGGDALDVQISGADANILKKAAEDLKATLQQFSEVSALEDTLAYDKEDLVLELTPQGHALGFTIDAIGRELRARLNGIEAASFPDGVRTTKIKVRLPEKEIRGDFLQHTKIRSPEGLYVPLADVVTISIKLGFSAVLRENGLRVVTVTGDINQDDPQRASDINAALTGVILPRIAIDYGVEWQQSGLVEQEQEFLNDALLGYSLCLLGIYLTLAWIFSSWTRPLVVMAIIPFGFVGTIFGHWVWALPLSIFSVVGIIGMSGIIINDSIVLITTIDEYAEDRPIITAVVEATSDRLRPVLLTTLTTVLGLLPLMFESSQQAQFLKPTVVTLCFGLGFGLVLILLVVPALIAVQTDLANVFNAYRRILFDKATPQNLRWVFFVSSVLCLALLAMTVGIASFGGDPLAPVLAISITLGTGATLSSFITLLAGLIVVAVMTFALGKRSNPS